MIYTKPDWTFQKPTVVIVNKILFAYSIVTDEEKADFRNVIYNIGCCVTVSYISLLRTNFTPTDNVCSLRYRRGRLCVFHQIQKPLWFGIREQLRSVSHIDLLFDQTSQELLDVLDRFVHECAAVFLQVKDLLTQCSQASFLSMHHAFQTVLIEFSCF